ncbi:eukaryotic translation initiation factor 2A [Mangifera indica]|uniref:eukaryotic translation initiation factor 2A n=1 Tax=Mangifera indica TaxID=29780 RepID=UPI001CFB871A|nr:eukaryotic translation initiation factor 2A [Mangifera indica]
MATVDAAASMDILVREPEGFYVWGGPPFNNGQPSLKLERVPCTNVKFSEDGSRLMVMTSESGIGIYDCHNLKEIKSFQVPDVASATLSPRGTYFQTFQKSSTPQEKNVILWMTETGVSVYNLFQKHMTKATWPSIRFSSDEAVACRVATNEIQFFDARDFAKGMLYRLRIPGVAAFELSKTPGSHIAIFVPESKGSPASVQIYGCDKDSQSQPLARKSFFRCSSVQLSWNRGSTGLLVVVQSDVDKTNQSYYGESKLNYLTTDGTHEGLVPLRKEGPVHDVQWSHSGSEFAVVYGFMPASATVFDKRCRPLLELGSGPYNTIRWNPKGKFLCLAGFGNLPGDMAFWDYEDKKQLRTTRAELSVTSEWSPDGCYFMTATTAPRLQVDNGIKIFHYDGSLYFKKKFEKLFQAEWKPESPDRFGDIAELIKSISTLKVEDSKQKGSTSKKSASVNPPATKPAAYRPPHTKQAAAIQAELLGESPTQEMSKNALKNKKKREKQKEKKAAEAAASAANGP